MSNKLQGVRGMNDLLPDEAERWEAFEEIVRDWLRSEASGWDGQGLAPALPADVVEPTRTRYIEAFERLTGRSFSPQGPFLEVDAVD